MKKLRNVKILFHIDYWDGPLRGICEYKNKYYWYDILDDYEYNSEKEKFSPRTYVIKEIEPWQISYELYWHSIFSTNVGTYTDFDKKLVNDRFKIEENFYEKRKREYIKIDYSDNKIIGVF